MSQVKDEHLEEISGGVINYREPQKCIYCNELFPTPADAAAHMIKCPKNPKNKK